jgi:NTE family protein
MQKAPDHNSWNAMTQQPAPMTFSRLRTTRLGIALGGGAARGFAHIGFLQEFAKVGLYPACLSGCSIGAFVGAAYAGGEWNGFVQRVLAMQWLDLLGLVDPVLPRCGLMSGEKALEFLAGFLRVENLEDCSPPLAVNATDAVTGEEVIFTSGPIIPAVRASIALPGMFTPGRQGNRLLLDGGLVNPLPVNLCRKLGAQVVVAVDLNAHVLSTDPCRLEENPPGAWSEAVKGMARRVLEKQPLLARYIPSDPGGGPGATPSVRMLGLFEVLINSIYIMQRTLNRVHLAQDPPDVLIAPELKEYRLLDFLKGQGCAEAGAAAARDFLRDLPDWEET